MFNPSGGSLNGKDILTEFLNRIARSRQIRKWVRKYSVVRADHGALDQVLELPHISGPVVSAKRIHNFRRYLLNPLPHAPGEYLHEVRNQLRYVIPELPQGRHPH